MVFVTCCYLLVNIDNYLPSPIGVFGKQLKTNFEKMDTRKTNIKFILKYYFSYFGR